MREERRRLDEALDECAAVRFDAAHFRYAGFDLAATAKTFWGVENQPAAGTVRLAFASAAALPAAGELLRLRFDIISTADVHTTAHDDLVSPMTLENIMIDDCFWAETNLAMLYLQQLH